jgi:hypothetical protein
MSDLIPITPIGVALDNQNASIATTTLHTPNAGAKFRLSWLVQVTITDVTGTITLTLGWTDKIGATTKNVLNAQAMNATGRWNGTEIIEGVAGANITYATTIAGATGTGRYAVFVSVERLN